MNSKLSCAIRSYLPLHTKLLDLYKMIIFLFISKSFKSHLILTIGKDKYELNFSSSLVLVVYFL